MTDIHSLQQRIIDEKRQLQNICSQARTQHDWAPVVVKVLMVLEQALNHVRDLDATVQAHNNDFDRRLARMESYLYPPKDDP